MTKRNDLTDLFLAVAHQDWSAMISHDKSLTTAERFNIDPERRTTMTTRITLNDICESTNAILRHARNKAVLDHSSHPDAYMIGYFSGFIETFLRSQTQEVRQDYLDQVARQIKTEGEN